MGFIISVFANKGGVAKTTSTLSIGHSLSQKGVKTLITDIDSQCNTTEPLLGIDPQNNLLDLLKGRIEIEDCIQPLAFQKGLFCLPNTSDLISMEPELIKLGEHGFSTLKNKIKKTCSENFDLTIIDCPPNHGIFTINALFCSDLAIVPTEAGSRNSIKGLNSALKFIDEIKNDGNPDLKFLKMIITKLDLRTSIGKDYVMQLRELFGKRVFEEYIPKNVDFQYAENANKTIFQYNPKAAGAKAYSQVTDEIIELLKM